MDKFDIALICGFGVLGVLTMIWFCCAIAENWLQPTSRHVVVLGKMLAWSFISYGVTLIVWGVLLTVGYLTVEYGNRFVCATVVIIGGIIIAGLQYWLLRENAYER